jgi:hypothetical protein
MKVCFFTENHYKGGLDTFLISLINAWPDGEDRLSLVCNSSHAGIVTIKEKTSRPITIKLYRLLFADLSVGGRSGWRERFIVDLLAKVFFKILQYPIVFPWYVIVLAFFFFAATMKGW